MKRNPIHLNLIIVLVLMALGALTAARADGLPSWNEGPSRAAIVDFVADVTDAGGSNFVPPSERVAVFDNDGTLWAEQPLYFQAIYMFDRINSLAPEHPEWKTEEPFASVLKGDYKAALAGGGEALLKMAAATHAGITA